MSGPRDVSEPPGNRLGKFLATGAGAGYVPVLPGTAGTVVAIPLALALASVAEHWGLLAYALALGLAVIAALWSSAVMAKATGQKDPSVVVVDEMVGYLVAVALMPPTWERLLAAFLLFRLFDIVKPPPCRQAERLPGALGIVTDDLVAGLYTNLLVRLYMASGLAGAAMTW